MLLCRSTLLVTVLTASVVSPKLALATTWTGDADFIFRPTVVEGIGGYTGMGMLISTAGTVRNTDGGFIVTNLIFSYTSAMADVGEDVRLSYEAHRKFSDFGGLFINMVAISGTAIFPTFGMRVSSKVFHDNEETDVFANAFVTSLLITQGPFSLGPDSGVEFEHAAAPIDFLHMVTTFDFVPSREGQVFTLEIPDSNDAATQAVPEPASLVIMGMGTLLVAGYASQRAKKKRLNGT